MTHSSPWATGAGIIEMPDGTRLRGRGLRRPLDTGDPPDFGVYLLGHEPPPMQWDTRWIEWPDFRLPRDRDGALRTLAEAHERAVSERVEIACAGGRGRTGTALACIAVMAGCPAADAVAYVRSRYDRRAVETPFQRRFVRNLGEGAGRSTPPERYSENPERHTEERAMIAAELSKISADSHIDEPHDLWFERMDADLRDRAPRRIQAERDGGWSLVIDDSPLGWSDLSAEEAKANESARVAAAAPDVRLDMMRTDGVNAEIIYPTIGLYAWNIQDPTVGRAACMVYNDWILERLSGIDRIRLAAMIPTWDIDIAIAEVRRVASNPSVAGLLLPLVGTPEWNLPVWEPLWAAIQETGIPAVMHQGSGHDMIFYRGWGSPTANLLTTQSMAPRAAALLSCSGVLERYPDLHVVMVEVNAGWMAWTMSTLDEYYLAHQKNGWTKPILAEVPSHYLRRQVHATFQEDPVALHNIPLTGTDCLLWGNDYPHPESTYPDSNAILDRLLVGVDEHDARAIVFDNAARLFGFSQDVVREPVA